MIYGVGTFPLTNSAVINGISESIAETITAASRSQNSRIAVLAAEGTGSLFDGPSKDLTED